MRCALPHTHAAVSSMAHLFSKLVATLRGAIMGLHTGNIPVMSALALDLQGDNSVQATLTAAAAAADAGATVHRVGSCEGATATPLQGHQLPSLGGGGNNVVLVCPGAQDSLEDEAAVLGALREAVAAAEARHLFVYASEPEVRSL